MKDGYLIAKDSAGNPSLLADCRTPIWEQEKQLRMIKAGAASAPDWAKSIDLICTERGIIMRWIRTGAVKVQAPAESEPEPKPKKKGLSLKNIVSLIVALTVLIGLAGNAQAQVYAAQTLTVPIVAAGGNSNALDGITIDVRKADYTAISFVTTSTNTAVTLEASVDGSKWHSWGGFNANATTAGFTNSAVGGVGWLRIRGVNNTGTIGATNTVKYSIKIP
jgi:hypothetical protein